MAHSNGIITAPVSFADVNAVLGTAHTDLGLLCKDSHINMWAKYKSLHLSYFIGIPTEAMLKAVNYGLTMPSGVNAANFVSGIINNTTGGLNGWGYSKPSGGAASPYRLQDFNGYNHNAIPIVSNFSVDAEVGVSQTFSCSCIIPSEGSDSVTLNDLATPKYFGIVFCVGTTPYYYITTQSTGGTYISFTIPSSFTKQTYRVYPYLCATAMNGAYCSNGAMPANTYWTLPTLNYQSCVVTVGGSGVTVKAIWSGLLSIATEIKNTSASNYTNCYTQLYEIDGTYTGYQDGPYSLNAGDTHNYTFMRGVSDQKNYKIKVTVNGGAYTIWANVIRES